jgi:hypothetical protein
LNLRRSRQSIIKELTLYSTTIGRHRVDVVFTPFDLVHPSAKVLVVGITPGLQQWWLAIQAAQDALRSGLSVYHALRAASSVGGFGGPMRRNLVAMLDGIGVNSALGLETTETMFGEDRKLIDGTSALLPAVLINGKNYTGHRPTFDRVPILTDLVDQVLVANLRMVPDALIVPLGSAANAAVARAAGVAEIDPTRILADFPHPSGANGTRVQQFAATRRRLRSRVRRWQENRPTG